MSLRQGFPHCARFSAAASRRSRARISVPWLATILSDHLPIIALVSHYPTNKLIGCKLLLFRNEQVRTFTDNQEDYQTIGYYLQFLEVMPVNRVDYPRVNNHFATCHAQARDPFDLHALSTLPAFILSQDQTLRLIDPKQLKILTYLLAIQFSKN